MYIIIYQKLSFLKKKAPSTLFSQSKRNNNFIFQKTVGWTVVYILSIKKYDIRKRCQVEFKKRL